MIVHKYYFEFYDCDGFWFSQKASHTMLRGYLHNSARCWEEHGSLFRQVKNRAGQIVVDTEFNEVKRIKETSRNLDMISIRQRTDGTVKLTFPYQIYKDVSNIPPGMEEWLTENTEVKWEYGKWMTHNDTRKIGAKITREDLVALKLKFPL
jgi:hypothetical protein